MINIEIKIKVAAAITANYNYRLGIKARQLPAKMIHIEYHRKSV